MSGVVLAAAMSHAPHITGSVELADKEQAGRFYAAAHELRNELERVRPDVLVVVASDHLTNFFKSCIPAFCVVNAARHAGPVEKWIKIPEFAVPGAQRFAAQLLKAGAEAGFDLAFSEQLPLEHGIAVPLSLVTPRYDLPIVPLIQNCMVPPMPTLARCHAVGQLIRMTAAASGLRVAVLGTGGLSHWPGAPESGAIDTVFDREFLALLSSDAPQRILELSDERLDQAGFGAWEVRQWATVLGAAGDARARVLAYEAIAPWETGCAVALFETNPNAGAH